MNQDLFNKLANEETNFFNSQFFAPVLKGKPIKVRIAKIIVSLSVTRPKNFEGWAVLQPLNYREARYVREPNMKEKQEYFKLFPTLHLVLCKKIEDQWFGIPSHISDSRFKVNGTVPVQLASETQLFDTIQVRFDGTSCWFEQIDQRHNPRTAVYLRESFANLLDPDKINFSGLTQEEKDAYKIAYSASEEAKKSKEEGKIRSSLERAGAKLQSYIERGNTYTIEFNVGNEKHRAVVGRENLAVESAGICLAGTDKNFDLQSLVGVIREGQRNHQIVRVGLNRNYGNDSYYQQEDADYDDD